MCATCSNATVKLRDGKKPTDMELDLVEKMALKKVLEQDPRAPTSKSSLRSTTSSDIVSTRASHNESETRSLKQGFASRCFLLLSPSRKAAEQEHEQVAEHHARADRRGEEVDEAISPVQKHTTLSAPAHTTTARKLLKMRMAESAGKIMRLEMSMAPIMRIPSTTVSAVSSARSEL